MSNRRISELIRGQYEEDDNVGFKVAIFHRVIPDHNWITLLLLTFSLLTVTGVLDSGDWFKTPFINTLVIASTITGFLAAKIKIKSIFIHPITIVFGICCVFTATGSLIVNVPLAEKYWEVWLHLKHWFIVASGDGINRDLVPYSFAFGLLSWILGYLGGWWTARHNNVWVPIFTAGISILTALSFLPGLFSVRFYIFVLLSMLLIAHMTTKIPTSNWRVSEAKLSKTDSFLIMQGAIWFTIACLLIASVIPMKVYTPQRAAQIWDFFRTPVASMEDEFTRLLGNVPSKTGGHGRHFGKFLPFIGSISFKNHAVLWSKSDYEGYWSSRAYSIYTSEGWMSADTEEKKISARERDWYDNIELNRESAKQELQFDFPSRKFMVSGNLEWVSENATLERLKPKTFVISLVSDDQDYQLPEYIADIARLSREYINNYKSTNVVSHESAKIEDFIKENTSELELTYIQRDKGKPISMRLTRTLPSTPDYVSYKFDRQIPANKSISMISHVSTADDAQLRKASDSYPGYIMDHYLNYPVDLPVRIKNLAYLLTYQETNSFDKAASIEKYLRSDNFTYSRSIEAPPVGEDGVDFFLFESKTGYSDYFASAMAVMLRTLGIPSRLMAGYSSGEYNSVTNASTIRDSDSHGWVQVYFSEYGWIDFEPTPAWHRPDRIFRNQGSPYIRSNDSASDSFNDGMDNNSEDFSGGPATSEKSIINKQNKSNNLFINRYTISSILIIMTIAGLTSTVWALIAFRFRGMTDIERKYEELIVLAGLVGIKKQPNDTIIMYGTKVGTIFPTISSSLSEFCGIYTQKTYSKNHVGQTDTKEWSTIRAHLLKNALKRTVGRRIKPPLG